MTTEVVLIVGGNIPWFSVFVGRRIFPGFVLIVPLLKEVVVFVWTSLVLQPLKKLLKGLLLLVPVSMVELPVVLFVAAVVVVLPVLLFSPLLYCCWRGLVDSCRCFFISVASSSWHDDEKTFRGHISNLINLNNYCGLTKTKKRYKRNRVCSDWK